MSNASQGNGGGGGGGSGFFGGGSGGFIWTYCGGGGGGGSSWVTGDASDVLHADGSGATQGNMEQSEGAGAGGLRPDDTRFGDYSGRHGRVSLDW